MKKKNYFYYILTFIFLLYTSCENDIQTKEDIPAAIKNDFTERYPLGHIETFHNYSDGTQQLDFLNRENNQEASIWYMNELWKMTYTEINDFQQLPTKVQQTFASSKYGHAKIIDINKVERKGIREKLYTLHFQFSIGNTSNVEHYVLINNDGLLLTTFTWKPNDPRGNINLSEDHFSFIKEMYKGAEIRGYINNSGSHEYFILHNNKIKYVFFDGEKTSDIYFWKETKYELDKEAKIPENVLKVLNNIYPNFVYTNVYCIESKTGNAYLFEDQNRDDKLGYCIGEDER